jgi:hypothetical protein
MGRKGVYMGRKGVWGEKDYGAEARMEWKGVWGREEYGALGTPRQTILHLHPQATTFLSPLGGIYLICPFRAKLNCFFVRHRPAYQ